MQTIGEFLITHEWPRDQQRRPSYSDVARPCCLRRRWSGAECLTSAKKLAGGYLSLYVSATE